MSKTGSRQDAVSKTGSRVSGVVLAAGSSSRFEGDRPKQLWPLDGEALVRRVVRTARASSLSEVWVVLGHAAAEVASEIADFGVRTVINPSYREGQSTSVQAGLARVAPGSSAALFIPADQPYLTRALIDRLIATYRETGRSIVVPSCQGRRGAPVLFDRRLFPELEELEGDVGGRAVLLHHAAEIAEVVLDDPLELADVDTFQDLRRLRQVREGAP